MPPKIRVGITGQPGFIGTHLYNFLGLFPDKFERIKFADEYFDDEKRFIEFVSSCDTIVHLAAMNRHGDPNVIYSTNIELVKKLIDATEKLKHFPQIIFSSSIQENNESIYGKSKKEGRILFEKWAETNISCFCGLIIPNVFGPFGRPKYNSVISTFSHQITHDEMPKIEVDGELKLIYVHELVAYIAGAIENKVNDKQHLVPHSAQIKVSEILSKLYAYKAEYLEGNNIPELRTSFEVNLFNTFKSYIDKEHYPVGLLKREDNRGYLVETIRELSGGQCFFSSTKPGITRGNHFHTRKIERFCVIKGMGLIKLRKIGTGEIIEYTVSGENPSTVDMPIFYTHNITNIGDDEMLTLFWCNEAFDPANTDTYFEEV